MSESGETLYCGVTEGGYLKSGTLFAGEGGRDDVTFGPNRRFFSTSLVLQSRDGDVIAEIRHKRFNIVGFGIKTRNSVLGPKGEVLLNLNPPEYFERNLSDFLLSRISNDLVLKRGEDVLGYTGDRPGDGKKWARTRDAMRTGFEDAVRGVVRLHAKLTGNHVEGQTVTEDGLSPETLAQHLTLIDDGVELDPRLVLVVLLFNEHFHSWRGSEDGPNQRGTRRLGSLNKSI